jgi:hypothetical protein
MTLNLDGEIVATAYDPASGSYTLARDGRRWTAAVALAQLEAQGANKEARRNHLANVLFTAMQGPPDGEPDARA